LAQLKASMVQYPNILPGQELPGQD
jgi:hypothetical protein